MLVSIGNERLVRSLDLEQMFQISGMNARANGRAVRQQMVGQMFARKKRKRKKNGVEKKRYHFGSLISSCHNTIKD